MKVKAKERIWTKELIEVSKNNLKKIPPMTKEQYQLIAIKNRGQKRSDEFRKQVGDFHRGKKLSEETKKKIGEASKGREVSQETRNKLRKQSAGRKHSDETRKRMSEIQKELSLTKNYDGLGFEKGSAHPNSKLTEKDVYEIKLLLREDMTLKRIADIYGVSRAAINHIKQGKTWTQIVISEDGERRSENE